MNSKNRDFKSCLSARYLKRDAKCTLYIYPCIWSASKSLMFEKFDCIPKFNQLNDLGSFPVKTIIIHHILAWTGIGLTGISVLLAICFYRVCIWSRWHAWVCTKLLWWWVHARVGRKLLWLVHARVWRKLLWLVHVLLNDFIAGKVMIQKVTKLNLNKFGAWWKMSLNWTRQIKIGEIKFKKSYHYFLVYTLTYWGILSGCC